MTADRAQPDSGYYEGWFDDEPEQEHLPGYLFHADGSYRPKTDEEREADRKRWRRYHYFQKLSRNLTAGVWQGRDGFSMRIQRVQGIRAAGGGRYEAVGPETFFASVWHRYDHPKGRDTGHVSHRALAVSDGLTLMQGLRWERAIKQRKERDALNLHEGRVEARWEAGLLTEAFAQQFSPTPAPKGFDR